MEYRKFAIPRPRARERKITAPDIKGLCREPLEAGREVHVLPGMRTRTVIRSVAPVTVTNRQLRRFFRRVDDPTSDEVFVFVWSVPGFVGKRSYDVAYMERPRRGRRPIITRARGNGRR